MFQWKYNCATVARLISANMDQKLSLIRLVRVKLHLLRCHHCRRYRKQLRIIRELLKLYATGMKLPDQQSGLSLKTKTRLKDALTREMKRR